MNTEKINIQFTSFFLPDTRATLIVTMSDAGKQNRGLGLLCYWLCLFEHSQNEIIRIEHDLFWLTDAVLTIEAINNMEDISAIEKQEEEDPKQEEKIEQQQRYQRAYKQAIEAMQDSINAFVSEYIEEKKLQEGSSKIYSKALLHTDVEFVDNTSTILTKLFMLKAKDDEKGTQQLQRLKERIADRVSSMAGVQIGQKLIDLIRAAQGITLSSEGNDWPSR